MAKVEGPKDGLATKGVTKPTTFHGLHASSVGCDLAVDAVGIVGETNPSGIDSSDNPEAGSGELDVARTSASSASKCCAGAALNQNLFQDVGLVETPPQSFSPKTDAQGPGATGEACIVSQCLAAFDALPNV